MFAAFASLSHIQGSLVQKVKHCIADGITLPFSNRVIAKPI